jgi:serine/threonine protein phosphatase PrpC
MPARDPSGDRTDPFLIPPEAVATEETLAKNGASLVRVRRDGETQLRWSWKGKPPAHIKKLLGALPEILPECEDMLLDGSGYTARDFHFTLSDAAQEISPASILPLIAQALEYDAQFAKHAQVSLKAFDPSRIYIRNASTMRLPALDDLRLCFYHLEDLATGAAAFSLTSGLAAWLRERLLGQPCAQAFSANVAALGDFLNALVATPGDFAGVVPSLRLAVDWAAKTHPGLVRENNEDSYIALNCQLEGVSDSSSLFAVADGMGGHNAGELASALCLELLRFYSGLWPLSRGNVKRPLKPLIDEHLRTISRELHESSLTDAEFAGMGTTLTGVFLSYRGALSLPFALVTLTGHVFNVGDSRAFAADERGVRPLSRDHSLVQELLDAGNITEEQAYAHPQRNVISQGIGISADVKPDISLFRLPLDSYTVLCSDGLSDLVRPQRIAELAGEAAGGETLADALVREALEMGGKDNITVIVLTPRVTFKR